MSTATREVAKRRTKTPRKPKPATWVVLGLVVLAVLATMLYTFLVLLQPGQNEHPAGSVTPTSQFAAGLKVEKNGQPRRDGQQWIVPVKITNGVMQPPAASGTPTPGAPTPAPEQAKVLNATIKVLFYDRDASDAAKQIVGSGVGNYYNKEGGLAFGQSADFNIVTPPAPDFKDYAVFPDTVWTDKDPIKTPEADSNRLQQPVPAALAP